MKRRLFLGTLGGLAAYPAAPDQEKKTRVYVLSQMFLRNGEQLPRIHQFMSEALLPAFSQVHSGPKICLEGLVAPHMPQFASIFGFESLAQMTEAHQKLEANPAYRKSVRAFESGSEPPFEDESVTLLQAASYSPEIVPAAAGAAPRVFELRVYHSPTTRQLEALHERFAGPEIRIFHRSGIHPVLYGSTMFGANMPNLTYLIPFENLAAREKAWSAFGADPEWAKVRKESTEKYGQIASVIQVSLYKAAPYSPVR